MIGTDRIDHPREQVVAPVDVANSINPLSLGYRISTARRRGRLGLALPEHQ